MKTAQQISIPFEIVIVSLGRSGGHFGDLLGQLVDLVVQDAGRTHSPGVGALKEPFGLHIQDFDVGHEGVAGFDHATPDYGFNPSLAAGCKARVRVDEFEAVLACLFEQVLHPFPGRYVTEKARVLKVRNEKAGNGFPKHVVGRVAGLIVKTDDGDRVFDFGGGAFMKDKAPDSGCSNYDGKESESRDEDAPEAGGLFPGDDPDREI